MSDTRTLVYGDDGSEMADLVWRWIDGHAWPGWRVEVVAAHPPADMRPVIDEEAQPHPWDPPSRRVPAEPGSFVEVSHLTAAMDPRLALDRPCDLLVIGPRGPGLLKSMHIGSTAEWLMQAPPAPMAVISHDTPTRRALICDDGSPHARAAVEAFASMPWASRVHATVLTVDDGRAGEPISGAGSVLLPEASRVRREGHPTRAILDQIEETSPDLVVMGVRGLSLIRRLTVGSTTSAILRSGHTNLLVAPAK